ncbi:MAG TPA: MFS transporter [Acidimicrobiales bacterium]|nr:MFS transporter [Acidimicrobiales bacterium]
MSRPPDPRGRMRAMGARTFRSLRIRNYRLFFVGQLVSVTGTWMQTVAQSWLVLNLTGSGVALGVTVALQFLPMLLFGMWGGLLADRLDKRRLLIATQAAGGVLAIMLWALVVAGTVELWMIYVLAFLLGMVTMVDMPTRQAFVIEMVGPDEVPNAVGLNSAMFNMGRILGPAAAGVVIASFGIAPAFLANGISFLAVIGGLLAMRVDELFLRERAPRATGEVRAGLRYVWGHAGLRSTLFLVAVLGTFGFNFVVVLPLLARYDFGGGAGLYSVFTSLMAGGSLIGALVAASRARPTRRVLVGSAAAFGALTLGAAVAPSVVTVGVLLFGMGAAVMLFLATANTTLQLSSEPAMRGRVMALYGLVFLGSTPVGGPLLGWISEDWGARCGLALGGGLSLAAALAAMSTIHVRRRAADVRTDPGGPPDLTVAAGVS